MPPIGFYARRGESLIELGASLSASQILKLPDNEVIIFHTDPLNSKCRRLLEEARDNNNRIVVVGRKRLGTIADFEILLDHPDGDKTITARNYRVTLLPIGTDVQDRRVNHDWTAHPRKLKAVNYLLRNPVKARHSR